MVEIRMTRTVIENTQLGPVRLVGGKTYTDDDLEMRTIESLVGRGFAVYTVMPQAEPEPEPEPEPEQTDYSEWTVTELKDEARERDLSGYSTMLKDELVTLLETDDGR
jgi:hypothetical protein